MEIHLLCSLLGTDSGPCAKAKSSHSSSQNSTVSIVDGNLLKCSIACFALHVWEEGIVLNIFIFKRAMTIVFYVHVTPYNCCHQVAHINNQQWNPDCLYWQSHSKDSTWVCTTDSSCHYILNEWERLFFYILINQISLFSHKTISYKMVSVMRWNVTVGSWDLYVISSGWQN